MKVGILIRIWWPTSLQKIAIYEARELLKLGHSVDILVHLKPSIKEYKYQYQDFLQDLNLINLSERFPRISKAVNYATFPILSKTRGKEITIDLASAFLSPLILKQYDILLCHETTTAITGYLTKKKSGIPYVTYVYDPAFETVSTLARLSSIPLLADLLRGMTFGIEKEILRNSNNIISTSARTSDRIKRLFGLKSQPLYLGCTPVDMIPKVRGNNILAFTRWEEGKKPWLLLKMLRRLREFGHAPTMIVAGSWTPSSYLHKFHAMVEDEGLNDQILVIPSVSEMEIHKLFLEARVYVHTIETAFTMGALDAAANGCPVIIPKGSGVCEILRHGEHGFFPDEGDLEEFIRYIGDFLSDERLAWNMGYQAWKTAQKYSWSAHTKKLEELLSSAVSSAEDHSSLLSDL